MKYTVFRVLTLTLLLFCGRNIMANDERIMLDGVWKFRYVGETDSTSWGEITVPGNWELQGFATPYYGKLLKKGIGYYKRNVFVPKNWRKQRVTITFDGVNFGYRFRINGKEVGSFRSAFNRKSFDVSHFLRYGKENVIEVDVETQPRGWLFDVSDDWSLSGISRSVYLTSLPKTYIEGMKTATHIVANGGTVDYQTLINGALGKNQRIVVSLSDAEGREIASSEGANGTLKVADAHLWTAETPYLYNMCVRLMSGKKVAHSYNLKIGIRELSWANGVFRLNGKAIKLHGVNHHDLSPLSGRAITEREMREDLALMKRANVNTIRLCHYPPNEKFLDLCDSLGMYCIDEVPFNFGDQWLYKMEYVPDLKERARMTIERDVNHPSVIIWSVGNENPITKPGLITGRYVYSLDSTRPYVFPQTHKPFAKMMTTDYDSVTMYSAHYPLLSELKTWPKEIRYPLISTEYAHALGTDMGQMQDLVSEWYRHENLSGGCVWMLFDQGIPRKADRRIGRNDVTDYVWLNDSTYYDTDGNQGADGITYTDRTPKTNYYQVRKVYSPVVVDLIALDSLKNVALVRIKNRYGFSSLSNVSLRWTLRDGVNGVTESGTLDTDCAAGDSTDVAIALGMGVNRMTVPLLSIDATDQNGYTFYERSFLVGVLSEDKLLSMLPKKQMQGDMISFIRDNVFARVGRKPTICETATVQGSQGKTHHIPSQFLLPCTQISAEGKQSYRVSFGNDTISLSGIITITPREDHALEVKYELSADVDCETTETGLTICLKGQQYQMRWIGKGPYANYPGKDLLSEFGVWKINESDLYFPGNRQQTRLLVVADGQSSLAVLPRSGNVCFERIGQNTAISVSRSVSSAFNKNVWPTQTQSLKGAVIADSFVVAALSDDSDAAMQHLFGADIHNVKTINPFYNSYDQ